MREGLIDKENINMAKAIIRLALQEDLEPLGDLSSLLTIDSNKKATAQIIAKEPGVMACGWIIKNILETYAEARSFNIELYFQDSDSFKAGDVLCQIKAPAQTLLACERTILNFLQRLCGIASYTHGLVNLIKDYPCKLLDTRKTMPGMRSLEKEAFRCGGGTNHRFNLSDMVMLKENHLACIEGDLTTKIKQIRATLNGQRSTEKVKIEVEINKDNLDKLDTVIQAGIDVVMLDNFSPAEATELIKLIRSKSIGHSTLGIELSGGINKANLVDYAKALPDYISTGSATTKANNLDLSMLITNLT